MRPNEAPQHSAPIAEPPPYHRDMATKRTRKTTPKPVRRDLAELGRTLQDAGRSLAKLATKTVSAAAEDALVAADDALVMARGRLKKVRTQMHRPPAS